MSSENDQSHSSSEEERKSEGFVVVSSESEEASSFEGENEEQEQNSEDFVPEDSKVSSESEEASSFEGENEEQEQNSEDFAPEDSKVSSESDVASSEVEQEEEQKPEDNVLDDSKPSSDTEGASSEEDQKSGSFVVVKSEVSSENEGALSEGEKEVMQNSEEIVSESSKVSSDSEATSSSDEEKEEEQKSEENVSESSKVTSDGVRASSPEEEKEEEQKSEQIVSEGSKVSSDSERTAPSLIEEGLQKEDTPAEDNEQSPPRQESFSVVVDLPIDDTPELQLGVEDIPLSKCNQVKYENKKGGCILTYCSEDDKEVVYVPLASENSQVKGGKKRVSCDFTYSSISVPSSSSSSSSSSEEEVEVNHLLSDNEQSSPGKQDHTIVNVSHDGNRGDTFVDVQLVDECEVCRRPTTEKTGKLIKPCNCKGGEYTIHQECLKKEITESQERDFQCTKCLSKYNVEVHRNSVFQDICSQGCLTVTIIVCTFFSIFCFISSFVYKLVPSFFFLAWGVFAVVLYAVEFCAFRLKRKRINYFVVLNKKQRKQRC